MCQWTVSEWCQMASHPWPRPSSAITAAVAVHSHLEKGFTIPGHSRTFRHYSGIVLGPFRHDAGWLDMMQNNAGTMLGWLWTMPWTMIPNHPITIPKHANCPSIMLDHAQAPSMSWNVPNQASENASTWKAIKHNAKNWRQKLRCIMMCIPCNSISNNKICSAQQACPFVDSIKRLQMPMQNHP